ncbi:MAG TPA: hypothetical protein VNX86_09730 [Rhizomicrobium sp.]|nr:hypothetical protein [Rhizomicrobium sp.]
MARLSNTVTVAPASSICSTGTLSTGASRRISACVSGRLSWTVISRNSAPVARIASQALRLQLDHCFVPTINV